MNSTTPARNLISVLFLLFFLTACAGNPSGQSYPDAPAPFKADDGTIAASNYAQTLEQPFTLGLGASNEGSTPITLDFLKPVNLPPDVTIVATAIERPDENGDILLTAGNLGYPPIIDKLHRPYIFHPIEHATIHPQEYIEVVIALQSSQAGAFIVQGFLLTLEMNGQTYQHYYPTAAVLCVEVDHATCDAAVKQADEDYHNQPGR